MYSISYLYVILCDQKCLQTYFLKKDKYQSYLLYIFLSSIYLHIYLSIFISIYLSSYLSIYLHIYLSIFISIYLSSYLSIYLSIYPYYLSIWPVLEIQCMYLLVQVTPLHPKNKIIINWNALLQHFTNWFAKIQYKD